MKDVLLFILKFGRSDDLNAIQHGTLNMKNFYWHDSKEIINIKDTNLKTAYDKIHNHPIFCTNYISVSNLKQIKDDIHNSIYSLDCCELLKKINKTNSDSVLLIPFKIFLNEIEKICRDKNLKVKADRIEYFDDIENEPKVRELYAEDIRNAAFIKKSTNKNKQEFRFIFEGEEICDGKEFILKINDISKYSTLFTIEDFKNSILKFDFKK